MRKLFVTLLTLLPLAISRDLRADRIEYFANGEDGRRVEFGSGGDGDFSDGPAQTGIAVVGAAITVDTDVKSVYEFTSFTLSGGTTLTASGSKPLVIRVSGDASIQGILQSEGGAGGDAAAAAPTATGGTPGAGGGRGGIGGERLPANANATTGLSRGGGTSEGGGILPNVNSGAPDTQYSGGGGCNGLSASFFATAGIHPADGLVGGAAGACTVSSTGVADQFEFVFDTGYPGGAGGGGGSTQSMMANGVNGAGGGGGGGAVHISASGNLSVSGTLRVRGGAGGNPNVPVGDYGAAGGGGSGGSIWIQTAGTLSGAGTLDVSGGAGGDDGASTGGGGSRGVIRLDAATQSFTGTFTPAASADRTYSVLPVTTEFNLKGGPACGMIERGQDGRGEKARALSFAAFAAFFVLYYLIGRRPSSASSSPASARSYSSEP